MEECKYHYTCNKVTETEASNEIRHLTLHWYIMKIYITQNPRNSADPQFFVLVEILQCKTLIFNTH